jgi:hypothetical protein
LTYPERLVKLIQDVDGFKQFRGYLNHRSSIKGFSFNDGADYVLEDGFIGLLSLAESDTVSCQDDKSWLLKING